MGIDCTIAAVPFNRLPATLHTVGGKEQDTAGEEALERALEELLLVEEARPEAGVVQLRVLDRVVRVDVLQEGRHHSHI